MDLSGSIRNFKTTLTGTGTLAFSNIPAGVVSEILVKVTQDATGGRTLNFPAGTIWGGGAAPTPSSGANELDFYMFLIDDSGTVHGNVVGQAYA